MALNKILTNICGYMILLLPFALLTGPAIPDIIISICSLLFIYISISEKKYHYFKNNIFYFFIIFYLYLIFSSLLSDYKYFSLKSSLFYFRFIFFSLAVWYLIENKKLFLNYFFYILIISFSVGLLAGFYEYIFSQTIFGKESVSNRLLLLTSDNLLLGQYLSRMFPIVVAFYMYIDYKSNWSYFYLFFLFIAVDVLTFLSGERTALVILFLSSFSILFLVRKLRTIRLITIIFSLIIIALISTFNVDIKKRNIDQTLYQLGITDGNEKIHAFSSIHESYYIASWNMFKNNPLIGIGPNNYRNECKKDEYYNHQNPCSNHPHNNYFQAIAEIGLIGAIFLFFIIIFVSKSLLRKIYSEFYKRNYLSDFQVCLLVSILCSIWPLIPTMNLFNNWINIIYFLPLGFLMHSFYSNSDTQKRL